MRDAGWYAAADGFTYWPAPAADPRVLYSVHMYEPWQATSDPSMFGRPFYNYPGLAPFGNEKQHWDAERVAQYLGAFTECADRMDIPPQQLVVGELGCLRRWPGCGRYLQDVLDVAEGSRAALGVLCVPRRQLGRHGLGTGYRARTLGLLASGRRAGPRPCRAHRERPVRHHRAAVAAAVRHPPL